MKRALISLLLSAVLLWTFALHQYHMGVLPPPQIPEGEHAEGEFIPRSEAGLNHLILKGTPYSRGLKAGELTREILQQQELELVTQLQSWINPFLIQLGIAGLAAYFRGADKFIEPNDLLEMYGTSKSAPDGYDFLGDKYTRQLAYHGLHEVGQMMVDRGIDMGCTVAAVPEGNGWILGRNFDFEGGRIFDSDKIVKWVFPDKGFAHVSVIWAGMVGLVTGINEKGVYISINAAGSKGFRRVGTPSTLVVYKILREAENVEQAVEILKTAHMFITDIFVVMDGAGRLLRVEKSPQKFEVIEAKRTQAPFVVTNHLIGKVFENDETNEFRKKDQTTLVREKRALELAAGILSEATADKKTLKMLELLRDKGRDENGRPLPIGHRWGIDALIATHSVIVDSARGILYVSQGPSVSGPFIGYDLAKSFATQRPVKAGTLPRDPEVSDAYYDEFKGAMHAIQEAIRLIKNQNCGQALARLEKLPALVQQQEPFHHVLGDVQACLGHKDQARAAWAKALSLTPAYGSSRRDLEKKLEQK